MNEYQYILTYGVTSETLTINPAGWDNIGVQFIRNEFYHSVLRNLSLTVRFVKRSGGGGNFILTAYEDKGIYALVYVTINKRNHATNGFELFYYGVLDFKRMTTERDFVEIGIMDGMKQQLLISRDTINFDLFNTISADNISITPFENEKTINLPPIDIILKSDGTCKMQSLGTIGYGESYPEKLVCTPNAINFSPNNIGDRLTLDDENGSAWNNSSQENISLSIDWQGNYKIMMHLQDQGYGTTYYCDVVSYVKIFDPNNVEPVVEQKIIDGRFKITSGGYSYENRLVTSPTINIYSREESTWNPHNTISTNFDDEPWPYIEILGVFDFGLYWPNLPPESQVVIKTEYGGKNTLVVWMEYGDINFTFKETSIGKAQTSTKCLFPFEAFTRLVQLTTSETNTSKLLDSVFFGRTNSEFTTYAENGTGSLDAIFTGWMARNYPNAPLNCNLRDLFKTFDSIYNLMLGYDRANDYFYIKDKSYAFNANYFMFDLGEVKGLKVSPLMEKYFNKITAGCENQAEYEELQGAFEFNVQREYSVSTPVKEEKDIRCKYNLDSVGIELARRRQYINNSSLDTKYDKNVYIVRTNGTIATVDATVTGFDGVEKYYNTMLSPRQNVVRWGNILMTSLYKNTNPVKFQTNAKQITMSYDSIDELSNIPQNELGNPLFIPELYTFDSYINSSILAVLNTDPHGFILFTYEGNRYAGFLNKLESGDYNKQAKYELIAANIDMQNLTVDASDITVDNEYVTSDQTLRL